MKKMMIIAAHTMVSTVMSAETGGSKPIPVTADNFIRAETDTVLRRLVKGWRLRQVRPLPRADADRRPDRDPPPNRDTLYSAAVSTSTPDR